MSSKRREIPTYGSPIIETHCHLDYLKQDPLDDIIAKSRQQGIEKIITIAVEPGNLDTVLDIARSRDHIWCSQGVHPHEAKQFTDEVATKIKSRMSEEKVLAVGEIGLDYHYNHSPRDKQIKAFETQLEIAAETNMPVIIHSRDAEDDTIAILKNHASKLSRKGVIHSFTSKIDLAKTAVELGFHLGFNGIITFKNAEDVRDAVRFCPVENLLLETDAPFLAPTPFRGRENAPFYLPFVAEKMAELKNLPVDDLLSTVYQNSIKLFKF
ncbi:MAG: TatD family deoxyribonuclease [Deltaproteobacteria bacterium]|nr:MAG: TatD family deoxyribonuclease [Deltaproteobacteria bacterium]